MIPYHIVQLQQHGILLVKPLMDDFHVRFVSSIDHHQLITRKLTRVSAVAAALE